MPDIRVTQGSTIPAPAPVLYDPSGFFHASLAGDAQRAIDIREGEMVNAGAFKTLVKNAVAANGPPHPSPSRRRPSSTTR